MKLFCPCIQDWEDSDNVDVVEEDEVIEFICPHCGENHRSLEL